MSMGLESILQSTPTGDNIALEMGDIKLQYNAALDDLKVVSASFESFMNACERYLALCDCVEANEGMLEPAVRDFVNHNGELAMALGIDLAMEDDSQDAQKENGEKVTEKKQGILRRMWEGIKKFFRAIFDAIGSFFHWIGNLFASTSKRIDWLKSDGKEIASKLTNIPASDIKQFIVGQEKDGLIPFQVVAKNSSASESMDSFATESDNETDTYTFNSSWIEKAHKDLFNLMACIDNYIGEAENRIKDNTPEYKQWMTSQASKIVKAISPNLISLLDIEKIHLSEDSGKLSIRAHQQNKTDFKVDLVDIIKNYDTFVSAAEKLLEISYNSGKGITDDARATIKRFETLVESTDKDTAIFLKVVASNITCCLTLLGKVVSNTDKLVINLQKELLMVKKRVL